MFSQQSSQHLFFFFVTILENMLKLFAVMMHTLTNEIDKVKKKKKEVFLSNICPFYSLMYQSIHWFQLVFSLDSYLF